MTEWVTWLDRRLASPNRTGGWYRRSNERLIALREWLVGHESIDVDDIIAWRGEPITAARRTGVASDLRGLGWRRISVRKYVPCIHEVEPRGYCNWCASELRRQREGG